MAKSICLLLFLYATLFATAFGIDLRTLTAQAVEYTVESKIQSRTFNVSRMISVPSMVLLKDGKKHRFSFEDAPGIWINYVYDANLGAGQFDWKSATREGPAPGGTIIHRNYCQVYELLLPLERLLDPTRVNNGSYALTEGSYQNTPCDTVTIRYPADDHAISTASLYDFDPNFIYQMKNETPGSTGSEYRVTPELYMHRKQELGDEYFAAIQLSIDKTPGRPFIYAIKAFNRSGKVVYDMNWGTVTFLDQIDPAEFQPPGKKVVEVNSHKEYSKQNRILFHSMYNNHANFTKRREFPGGWYRPAWMFIMQYGAVISAITGLSAVAAILLLKLRKR